MLLWKLVGPCERHYDYYSMAIVVAPDSEAAKKIRPGNLTWEDDDRCEWARTPDEVTCTLIGLAVDSLKEGDIVATSFHNS
jgi:hypothetical protein